MLINNLFVNNLNNPLIDKRNNSNYFNVSFTHDKFQHQSHENSLNTNKYEDTNSLKSKLNKLKTNIWLSSNVPTFRNIRAFFNDFKAYTYEIKRPYTGQITDKKVLAEVNLKKRNEKGTDKAEIRKVSFDDNTAIYYVTKGKERLAFVDADYTRKDSPFINYVSTIVGGNDYRGLLMTLMQAVVEDCVNSGIIPEIQAIPEEIGNNKFNRVSLYKYYGAQTKYIPPPNESEEYTFFLIPMSIVSKDKVIDILNNIQNSPNKNFIMNETQKNFEQLKQNDDSSN